MYAKCGALEQAKDLLDGLQARNSFTWSALISGYVQGGQAKEAFACFDQMQQEGFSPDAVTFVCMLKACGSLGALEKGESIHSEIFRQGLLKGDIILGGALVDMYAKCSALTMAKEVFDELTVRNAVIWSMMIAAYAQCECNEETLNCFEEMQCEGLSPDAVTFACILKVCGGMRALERGKHIHTKIVKEGLEHNAVLSGSLVDMYAKCGALVKAKEVLEGLPVRDVVTWSALIAGCAQGEHAIKSLSYFEQMLQEGVYPDSITFVCMLKACGSIGTLDKGIDIHSKIVKQGLLRGDVVLANALLDMYVKCSALSKAKEVLDGLPISNMVTWSTLIAGYAQEEDAEEAFKCFEWMQHEGFSPDATTFFSLLRVCGHIQALKKGEAIHSMIVSHGLGGNFVIGGALVDMYAKCGALAKAKEVLEGFPVRDVTTWNALIAGYAQEGDGKKVLNCFQRMQLEGHCPDAVTFASVLKACGNIRAREEGEYLHSKIVQEGLLQRDAALGGSLVGMYAKCGAFVKAREVLEELPLLREISWSALIAGYAQGDYGKEALDCYKQMQQEGLSLDAVTFICILKACGSTGALDQGEKIHVEIASRGLLGENPALGNALIDMYVKCGAFMKAKAVLEVLPGRNIVTWSALIAGYAQGDHAEEALETFEQMQWQNISPTAVTFACILKACGCIGALDKSDNIYSDVVRLGLAGDDVVGSALVGTYAKCGALVKASEVLERLPFRSVVAWNALLAGYAQGENAKEALTCIEQMCFEGLIPDEVTLLCVLTACAHFSLLDQGEEYIMKMSRDYGIVPCLEHYSCIVNLYCLVGLLDMAVAVIKKMSFSDHLPMWLALLTSCYKWGNVKLGKWTFQHAVLLNEIGYEDGPYKLHC